MRTSPGLTWLRRAALLSLLLPLLAVGIAWGMASHPGGSSDDDFHLASTWCAWGTQAYGCVKGGVERGRQLVSVPALDEAVSLCMRRDTDASAACIGDPDWPPLADSANLDSYPGGYYAAARLLVGDDATASILRIRVVAFVFCTALVIAAGLLLRPGDRWRTWWLLLLLSVPLTVSQFASNNPSGPTAAGCIAVTAASCSITQRRRTAAVVAAVVVGLTGAVAAAASRPDGWQFAAIALVLGATAGLRRFRDVLDRRRLLGLGLVLAVLAVAWFAQRKPPTLGYSPGGGEADPSVTPFSLLLELPALYVGEFATRLGWMDLPMPAIVWGSTALLLGGAITLGVTGTTGARLLALIGAGALWVAVPFFMQLSLGRPVFSWVQPRYLIPLVLTTAVLLAIRPGGGSTQWRRSQLVVLSGLAVVAHMWALHRVIRRSVTGLDVGSLDLSGGAEWWWPTGVLPGADGLGPSAVWLLGSAAFAVVVAAAALAVLRHQGPAVPPAAAPPDLRIEDPAPVVRTTELVDDLLGAPSR